MKHKNNLLKISTFSDLKNAKQIKHLQLEITEQKIINQCLKVSFFPIEFIKGFKNFNKISPK